MKRFVLKALYRVGMMKYFNFTCSMMINGSEFRIPLVGGIGINNLLSLSEMWMLPVLKKLFEGQDQSKVFIDIGANIGQTLLKVKSFDRTIQYVGIEPNPLCVSYLKELIVANAFSDIEVFPVGIGKETSLEVLQFYSDSKTDESASLVEDFRISSTVKSKMHVPVFKFSDIPKLKNTVQKGGIIKIDVEGAELEVIQELAELWNDSRPYVIIEILPIYSIENTFRMNRQNRIEELISLSNYTIFRIDKKENLFLGLSKLDSIGIHNDLNLCDYILCPIERSHQLEGEC